MNDAPFGKTLDGRPKTSRRGRPRKDTAPKSSGPAAPSPRSTRPPTGGRKKNYTDGITGFLHMMALPLLPTLPDDAAAIMLHADSVADAINKTAQTRPEVAAMCEKIMTAGPYGLILGALLKPLAQVAENHQLLPTHITRKAGAVPREHLGPMLAAKLGTPPAEQHVNGYAHVGT